MKIKRDDKFQKNEKILKNRFNFEKTIKRKNIAFQKSKKKCRNKIKRLNKKL